VTRYVLGGLAWHEIETEWGFGVTRWFTSLIGCLISLWSSSYCELCLGTGGRMLGMRCDAVLCCAVSWTRDGGLRRTWNRNDRHTYRHMHRDGVSDVDSSTYAMRLNGMEECRIR